MRQITKKQITAIHNLSKYIQKYDEESEYKKDYKFKYIKMLMRTKRIYHLSSTSQETEKIFQYLISTMKGVEEEQRRLSRFIEENDPCSDGI